MTGLLAGGALDALATAAEVSRIKPRPGSAGPAGKTVLEQFVRSSGALVNYAVALTLIILSILYYAAGTVGVANDLAWLVATPIHLAILVLFAAICCLLVSIWLDALGPSRRTGDAVYPAT